MKKYTKEDIVNDLIEFTFSRNDSQKYGVDIGDILVEFEGEWDAAPCDPEGATKEQNEELDRILDKYADKIIREIETQAKK